MASNKFDTKFVNIEVNNFKLTYKSAWGNTLIEGTPQQIITHLLTLGSTGHKII